MARYFVEAAVVIIGGCLLVRLADLLLAPVLPLLLVAAFLVGVLVLVVARPRSL